MGTEWKEVYRGFTVPCKVTANEIRNGLEQDPDWCPAADNTGPGNGVCHNGVCGKCIFFNDLGNRYALECALEAGIFPETAPEPEDADLDAQEDDPVNHPNHYCVGGLECIEVMERVFGTEAVKTFCRLNAFKYLFRSENKNGRQDIDKAHWYTRKYGELCDKNPILPKGAASAADIRSAVVHLVDIAQGEARKDCEPTPAVWAAVAALLQKLGIETEKEDKNERK